LKILVCWKQVIDVELNVQLRDGRIVEEGLQYAMNAYDESALEAALQLKDQIDCEVVVLSMGPDRVTDVLKKALAMGADRAVHLDDPAVAGGDSGAAARAIAAYAKDKGFDLIMMGRQAQDTDAATCKSSSRTLMLRWIRAFRWVSRLPKGCAFIRLVRKKSKIRS